MTKSERTPMEEIGKRTGEAGAGLAAAAHASALQQYRAMMLDSRRRTADGHAFRIENLGGSASPMEPIEMGNILVTGDVYGDQAVQSLKKAVSGELNGTPVGEQTQPPKKKSKLAGVLSKAAFAAALLGIGGVAGYGIPWAAGMFEKTPAAEQPTPVDVDRAYELRLEIE